MAFQQADSFSLILFALFSALMLGVQFYVFRESDPGYKKYFLLYLGYLIVFSGIVASGIVQANFIPFGPILVLSVLVSSAIIAFSKLGANTSSHFSLAFLIGIQAFRLPLELILHHWAGIGTVPPTMTWTGQNLDIVTGVVSLLTIPFLNKSKKLAWLLQIIGFAFLLNVLRVVIMSSPLPFASHLENPLLLIAYFPYALIAPLFVGVALTFHLLTFRKLLQQSGE